MSREDSVCIWENKFTDVLLILRFFMCIGIVLVAYVDLAFLTFTDLEQVRNNG